MQPFYQPSPGTFGAGCCPPRPTPTIGDRLTDAGVDWAWYCRRLVERQRRRRRARLDQRRRRDPATPTGCTDPNVDPNTRLGVPAAHWPRCPDNLFQYHHQPFNYYADFSTATPDGLANRAAHLQDEVEFEQARGSVDAARAT